MINPNKEDAQHSLLSAQMVLILGGARSGKSTFAERLALQSGKSVAYIATATAGDEDMRERIKRHQAARPAHWCTIELQYPQTDRRERENLMPPAAPLNSGNSNISPPTYPVFASSSFESGLTIALRQASVQADVILLDCITLWLANGLFMYEDKYGWEQDPPLHEINEYIDRAVATIEDVLRVVAALDHRKTLVVVSNEVGLGIVPAYALGRLYRDALGRVNQRLASTATRVYLMVAGLGVNIKRLHDEASL
jgi:adenosylcobinamide kinase/adenosylcobinamide-phosphate guanylyltransferase